MKIGSICGVLIGVITVSSCVIEINNKKTPQVRQEKNGIIITQLRGKEDLPKAQLIMTNPIGGAVLPSGEVNFSFLVRGFKLGKKTKDASKMGVRNDPYGQYIFFQINDTTFRLYDNEPFNVSLDSGHYHIVAGLSKSYNETLKNTWINTEIEVDDAVFQNQNINKPMLIYHHPKGGVYKMNEKILLDFKVFNTNISERESKLKLKIDKTEFWLADEANYTLEGLSTGIHSIQFELVHEKGIVLSKKETIVIKNQ